MFARDDCGARPGAIRIGQRRSSAAERDVQAIGEPYGDVFANALGGRAFEDRGADLRLKCFGANPGADKQNCKAQK